MRAANETKRVETNPNISMSYEAIAEKLGITVKEVKEAEASAIKKLRHPRNGKAIKEYLGISASGEDLNGF